MWYWSNILLYIRVIVVTDMKEAGPEERRMGTGIYTIQMETFLLVYGLVIELLARVP